MDLQDKSWFTALQLSPENFSQCPRDADPLIWGFEETIISEEQYLIWARDHYQLPTIKGEFFAFGVDKTLVEKYADFANWSPTCFPVYEWEDVLYVACLEPGSVGHGKSVCFILSPYRQMTNLWLSMQTDKGESIEEDAAPPPPVFDDSQIAATLTSIDFSSMGLISSESPPAADKVAKVDKTPKPAPPAVDDDKTPPPVMTPPPPVMEAPAMAPPPPADDLAPPPPVLVMPPPPVAAKAAPPPPPVMAPPPPIEASAPPPPVMVPPPPVDEAAPIPPHMSTTDTAIAGAYIPDSHLISEEALAKAAPLEACTTAEQAMIHVMKTLKKDFRKFLWLPHSKGKGYIPGKAFGPWVAAPATWTTPVNITEPNIFRIAHNSKMPFHGPISMNPINAKYFALWDQGQVPDHLTIFPLCAPNKECVGLLVGAGKGPDFDQLNSLKKFQNLMDLAVRKLNLGGVRAS